MRLIGGTRSPYVRRVAISLGLMGFDFTHDLTSPIEDPEAVRLHNPLVRIPALVLDDGDVLVESYAILDTMNEMADPDKRLIPMDDPQRRDVMKLAAIATGATDKLIWSIYERRFRPEEKIHEPWIAHNIAQLLGGLSFLNERAAAVDSAWLSGSAISLADVSAVVVMQQTEMARPDLAASEKFAHLAEIALRCASIPAFASVAPQ